MTSLLQSLRIGDFIVNIYIYAKCWNIKKEYFEHTHTLRYEFIFLENQPKSATLIFEYHCRFTPIVTLANVLQNNERKNESNHFWIWIHFLWPSKSLRVKQFHWRKGQSDEAKRHAKQLNWSWNKQYLLRPVLRLL